MSAMPTDMAARSLISTECLRGLAARSTSMEPVMLTERSCLTASVYNTDFFAFDSNYANRCACVPVLAIQPEMSLMVRVQPEGKGGTRSKAPS